MRAEDGPAKAAEQMMLQASTLGYAPEDSRGRNVGPGTPLVPRARLRPQAARVFKSSPVALIVPARLVRPEPSQAKADCSWERLMDLPMPSEQRLRELFDLTPAEARLARGLARGDALEEVAGVLKIKMTTARSQLAAIFAKTQTRRQAGLVAILSRLAHLDEAAAD